MGQLEDIGAPEGANEFLTFRLGEEEYGVDILKVQEIRGYGKVTPVAGAPASFKGVIDLRGTIVPVVDMRIKVNLGEPRHTPFMVIVLSVANRVIGMAVDSVSDVLTLGAGQLRPPPQFGDGLGTQYIAGLGHVGDRMLILIDIERLLIDTGAIDRAPAALPLPSRRSALDLI